MMDMVKDMMIGSTGPRGGRKPGLVESAAQSAVRASARPWAARSSAACSARCWAAASALKVLLTGSWVSIVLLAVPRWRAAGAQLGCCAARRPTTWACATAAQAPSKAPNSVSSQADAVARPPAAAAYARIAPLALRGDGPATIARLRALVRPCRAPPS
jgi:hypothetical protein